MRKNLVDQRKSGDLVVERVEGKSIPEALASDFQTFKQSHVYLKRCADEAEQARQLRDAAMGLIGVADGKLDAGFAGLAKMLPAADLGSLSNPFAQYSKYSLSALCRLPYASEVPAARDLLAKLAAKGPPQEITVKIAECLQYAAEVERALVQLAVPQRDYDEKRAVRDQAAMAWSKAYAKLKLRAELAYEDQPGAFAAIFAKPEPVQRTAKRRKKKQAAEPAKPE